MRLQGLGRARREGSKKILVERGLSGDLKGLGPGGGVKIGGAAAERFDLAGGFAFASGRSSAKLLPIVRRSSPTTALPRPQSGAHGVLHSWGMVQ